MFIAKNNFSDFSSRIFPRSLGTFLERVSSKTAPHQLDAEIMDQEAKRAEIERTQHGPVRAMWERQGVASRRDR